MLRAGIRYCPACGTSAYPADAAWLGDDLILASFGPLCEHSPEPHVQIVTPSALDKSPLVPCRVCGAAAMLGVGLCSDCRCTADTVTGGRCTNRARGHGLCGVHLARRQRQRRDAAR